MLRAIRVGDGACVIEVVRGILGCLSDLYISTRVPNYLKVP